MSLVSDFKNELCQEFIDRVDTISLHTNDPGTVGDNDSGLTHQALVWTTPKDGIAYGQATFTVNGDYTHVGMWGDSDTTFRGAVANELSFDSSATVTVMVMHQVGTEVFTSVVNR